ncbi:hypothetical protein ACJJIL_12305 [Microbulbifer sp. EKSA005]|uniref:hypothetical protein n=1 Tax=Microbulbifer sp. EKSA005 TaxID=3243364 RepID=UPI004040FAFB
MKIVILDEFEFEDTGSEEFLVIALARSNQYSNLMGFFEATAQEEWFDPESKFDCGNGVEFKEYPYSSTVRRYLKEFIGRAPDSKANVVSLHGEWDEQDLLIEEPGTFIRYYWQTSA